MRASVHKPSADRPVVDQIGNLGGVLFHHDEVRIALDADVRPVNDLGAAASGIGQRRHGPLRRRD
jgi:hypothetical protein